MKWQPIKDAPLDGTPVDVWTGNAEFPMRWTDVEYREPTDSEWWVHGSDDILEKYPNKMWMCHLGGPLIDENEPTHFMAVPDPPSEVTP